MKKNILLTSNNLGCNVKKHYFQMSLIQDKTHMEQQNKLNVIRQKLYLVCCLKYLYCLK